MIITNIATAKDANINICWIKWGVRTCKASNITNRKMNGTSENDPTINDIARERMTKDAFPQKVVFPSGVVICISGRNHRLEGKVDTSTGF